MGCKICFGQVRSFVTVNMEHGTNEKRCEEEEPDIIISG